MVAKTHQIQLLEAMLISASDALMTYLLEQQLGESEDILLHHRLVAELKLTTDKYAHLLFIPNA